MKKVDAEFKALTELHEEFKRQPAVVDDDFPEWQHYYTSKLRAFLKACIERYDEGFFVGIFPPNSKTDSLSFSKLREANKQRVRQWHPGGVGDWSQSDWAVAAAGEMGEVCDVVKKLNRARDGLVGNHKAPNELFDDLGKEIADTIIYLDLLALRSNIDVAEAIKQKFNEVSDRNGFDVKL